MGGGSAVGAEQQERVISVRFVKAPDYRLMFATGVYGGLTPHGCIRIDFFTDTGGLPDQEDFKISGTKMERVAVHPPDRPFERYLVGGVLIPLEHLPSIMEWFQGKLEEARASARVDVKTGVEEQGE